jgi:hypothetical protein
VTGIPRSFHVGLLHQSPFDQYHNELNLLLKKTQSSTIDVQVLNNRDLKEEPNQLSKG